ncbi:MAG: hypothetical protein QGD93_02650 [Actinomycetota bacterium]|nr:hypothetical protein [Actinomycetota bacterium]
MMAQQGRPGALEWDKEGIAVRVVRAHLELPSGVTLTGTPTVRIDKLTLGSEPEDWVDATSDFTISGIVVVNSVADDGSTNLGTSQAVQFQIDADPDTEPDETDAPTPGDEYRVVITATRSDAGEWVGKVGLIIHF